MQEAQEEIKLKFKTSNTVVKYFFDFSVFFVLSYSFFKKQKVKKLVKKS